MIGQINTAWAIPWYTVMVIINVVGLVYCAVVYKRSLIPRDGKDSTYRKWVRIMGVIFTLVSAYRAIGVWSIPYTFRIPNTVAEVSFAGLIAYAMLRFNTYLPATDDARANKFKSFITKTPYILVGCLVIAQPLDTWDNISVFVIGGTIMETLWGIGFLSILPLAIIQLRRVFSIKDKEEVERLRLLRYTAIIIVFFCVIYCTYRWIFTLPGMWVRALNEVQTEGIVLEISIQLIRTPSLEYSEWGVFFLIWYSTYFSILTWVSIFLMKAPRPREISGKHDAKLTLITLTLIAIAIIALLTTIGIPADIDEKIILGVLGGLTLVPIAYIFVFEIKRVK